MARRACLFQICRTGADLSLPFAHLSGHQAGVLQGPDTNCHVQLFAHDADHPVGDRHHHLDGRILDLEGSGGTGAAVARRFAAGGYRVAMLAGNEKRSATLESELPGSRAFAFDLADLDRLMAVA